MGAMNIPWGAKVTDTFLDRLCWVVDDLDIGHGTEDGAGKMMGAMGWETGRTFKANIINKAGSGATGLIQFMPATAHSLGTTTAALAKMSEEDQLNYVWKYFAPYKGRLKELSDIYAAILWPKGVGKPDTFVYWDKATKPTTYRQNSGIDMNKNGQITKGEATAKVTKVYEEGFEPENVREYWPANERDRPLPPTTPYPEPEVYEVKDEYPEAEWMEQTRATYPATAKPNVPIASTISKAAAGWQGNFAGAALILGGLLGNAQFADALGKFTLRLANGEGYMGAFAALVGAALIAYRGRQVK